MALEDRIRSSADAALADLSARFYKDIRAVVDQLTAVAQEESDRAVEAARRTALEQAHADTRNEIEAAEGRLQARIDAAVAEARGGERDAEMAAVARLLESIRSLDAATSLSEVLDALGQAAAREASRAAVLVIRNERLVGWRLTGFGAHDTQPKGVDLGLKESGVMGAAVAAARPVTTRDAHAAHAGAGFATVPDDRMGFAVPVSVGGRVVAVVYADSADADGREHTVPSAWPEVIEVLARHAGRCLEALTVQKTTAPSRFWVPASSQPSGA